MDVEAKICYDSSVSTGSLSCLINCINDLEEAYM